MRWPTLRSGESGSAATPGSIACQPEIENFDRAVGCDLMLAGFRSRWTMPFVVRGFERVGNLARDAEGFIERSGALRWAASVAFDELHDEVIRANVVKMADVGMVQRGEARASRSKRSVNRRSETLMATSRPGRVSWAR